MPDQRRSSPRLEIILVKPRVGWYPKPTVVFGGHGYPAQWGTGTWQVPTDEVIPISVFLYNRLWKFGAADALVGPDGPARLVYRAPVLPFLRGKLTAAK
ncbi:MAG: hypothetical protein ABI067_05825 [Leifsonia sp.]